jgi:hypothetical protein
MKHILIYYILLGSLMVNYSIRTEYIIEFFFESTKPSEAEALEHVFVLGKMTRKVIKSMVRAPLQSGIPVVYNGFWTVSDNSGRVAFRRDQSEPIIHILITDKIRPLIYHGQTVDHLQITDETNVVLYKLSRVQDPITKLYVWKIEPIKVTPGMRVPEFTLIIFADPKTIIVPQHAVPTVNSPHLFLPTLGVTKRSPIAYVMNILKTNVYLRRVSQEYRENKDRYAALIES